MNAHSSIQLDAIGQIAVAISDFDTAKCFYQKTLNLPLLFDVPPNLAFFDVSGIRLMLTTLQGDPKDHHTSVIYYKVKSIETVFNTLESQQVNIERQPQLAAKMADHQLWMGFIRDPDNNLIGIMEEKPLEE